MSKLFIIVERKEDWTSYYPSEDVVTAQEYLELPIDDDTGKRVQVINLCRHYKYLRHGYYCSLLAEARGHKVIPSVRTISELARKSLYSLVLEDLDRTLDKALAAHPYGSTDGFTLTLYFGRTDIEPLQDLARQLFEAFPCPLLLVEFKRNRTWHIEGIKPGAIHKLREDQEDLFANALDSFSRQIWRKPRSRKPFRYDLAILHDPGEAFPPSDAKALKNFVRVGRSLGIDVELIGRKDYARLAEFDALLIRVDTETEDKDDEIIFSPDPALLTEGFDNDELQKYTSGEKKYRIMAFAELKKFTVSVGDDSYDLLTGTHEGISFSPTDKYNTELTLSDAFFGGLPGGDHAVTIHVEDANGGSNEISTTYRLQGLVPVTEKSYDLWANTVTLQVVDFTRSANVTFGLCGSDGQWKYQTGTSQGDDFISATFAPQWQESTNANGHTVYTRETGTGVVATHGYDYKVTIDGTEKSGSFTAGAAQTIPNADMSGWSMTSGFAFPNAEGGSFWSSGNNTMTKTLCTSTDVKFGKAAPAAKLTSTNMLVLAAGNLFTGTFAYKSFTGTVQFGQPYDFTVRPSALKVKYHAKVGTVDKVRTSGDICPYIKKGDPDMARIFVAIVDWNAPHQVVSAMTTTKGAWDPEKGIDNVSEGKILGYGSLWITQSTEGDDMQDAELEIVWYDHETRPSGGGYSLVISCACNAYGDYFTGCSTNVMYVDDFEWVY